MLETIAPKGVQAKIGTGGNLVSELGYGNHTCARKHGGKVLKEAVTDVALGRIIVFPVTQV